MNATSTQQLANTAKANYPMQSETELKIVANWLNAAVPYHSPFCNQRLKEQEINLLVIHAISLPEGRYHTDYVRQLFMGELEPEGECGYLTQMQVSSHLFIRRDGEVVQFVPFNLRAWHAGDSSYAGMPNCNDYSIGIELEGTEHSKFTSNQYASLASTTACLIKHYPAIKLQRIVGHSDIALPAGRKTDPGKCFDWHGYTKTLKNLLSTTDSSI